MPIAPGATPLLPLIFPATDCRPWWAAGSLDAVDAALRWGGECRAELFAGADVELAVDAA